MVDKIIKYIPFTTLAVIYLYVCGTLFLIGFWGTFGIDISNFVTLAEIPKSFVFPFAVTNGIFFVVTAFDRLTPLKQLENVSFLKGTAPAWIIPSLITCGAICSFLLIVWPKSLIIWVLGMAFLPSGLLFHALNIGIFFKAIPDFWTRKYILTIIIVTPFFCLFTGKGLSLQIWENKRIKEIKVITDITSNKTSVITDSTRLKLLGFLGDKLIISTLDNKRKYILNQEDIEGVVIEGE